MFEQMTLLEPDASTPSPVLADGSTPSTSQDGPQIGNVGQDRVPASRSRRRGSEKARRTPDTSGLISFGSSESAALQRSLANRLAASLDLNGSMEFSLTWKDVATPAGRRICRLAARARRTSDSDCSGRPTCAARNWRDGWSNQHEVNARPLNEVAVMALEAANLVGYPTPTACSPATEEYNEAGESCNLRTIRLLFAGYPTPSSSGFEAKDLGRLEKRRQECRDRTGNGNGFGLALGQAIPMYFSGFATPRSTDGDKNARSPEGALAEAIRKGSCNDLGTTSMLCSVETGKHVASRKLNPAFSLWLMGYGIMWLVHAPVQQKRSKKR